MNRGKKSKLPRVQFIGVEPETGQVIREVLPMEELLEICGSLSEINCA